MTYAISAVFIAGYLLIAFEHVIKVNKAAVAVITGVLCWTLYVSGSPSHGEAFVQIKDHTAGIAGILFFLMGAMTIVEIIDAHNGFDIVTSALQGKGKRGLLWLTAVLSFFLSAVLDNLTTTIIMVSLLTKILPRREDVLLFIGLVIIAVNAGGAWSPIGDVTTTMLWIDGRITTLSIVKSLFLPSVACCTVPFIFASFMMKDGLEKPGREKEAVRTGVDGAAGRVIFFLGMALLLFVPVFKNLTRLPPFTGMILGLGVLWVFTEILHRKSAEEYRQHRSVVRALQRIDMPTILFFLGILLAVSALEGAGILARLAAWLDRSIGNIDAVAIIIGFLSSIVDNVPLVAAGIKMYPLSRFPVDHRFWSFLSYCAGTGGSLLVIGSAAGVAAMGMAKIDFFWYLRKIAPLALAGYFAGAAVFLLLNVFF